jgi:hypothetical protein
VPLKPDEAETFPASSLLVRRISIASLHPCTEDSDGAKTCNARLGLVCRVGMEEAATESQVKTATSRRWPTRRRHRSSEEEAANEAQPPRTGHRRWPPAAGGGAARVVSPHTHTPESINEKAPRSWLIVANSRSKYLQAHPYDFPNLDRVNGRDPIITNDSLKWIVIINRDPNTFTKPLDLNRICTCHPLFSTSPARRPPSMPRATWICRRYIR